MHTHLNRCLLRTFGPRMAVLLLAIAALTTHVRADTVALPNLQSRTANSSFVLDFGALGGVATANISSTYIRLEVDPAAGTARFATYVQFVDPILMPDGSSTGPITVVVERPGVGTFDRSSGTFNIPNDEYVIYFEGDLSSFGITSPFRLPSPSAGVVEFNTAASGVTRMEWAGETALPSPFEPGAFIPLAYTCTVNGAFTLESNATWVMRSSPEGRIIDARQPHPLDDPAVWQGYESIDLTFNAPLNEALTAEDIAVTEVGGDGIPPNVIDVLPVDDRTYRITFDEPLEPAAWTRIEVPEIDQSRGSVCIGSLPGDVNGDRFSNVADLISLVDSLRGATAPLALHQCDIDRSGVCTPADLVTLINLLTGARAFDVWHGASLAAPDCP